MSERVISVFLKIGRNSLKRTIRCSGTCRLHLMITIDSPLLTASWISLVHSTLSVRYQLLDAGYLSELQLVIDTTAYPCGHHHSSRSIVLCHFTRSYSALMTVKFIHHVRRLAITVDFIVENLKLLMWRVFGVSNILHGLVLLISVKDGTPTIPRAQSCL